MKISFFFTKLFDGGYFPRSMYLEIFLDPQILHLFNLNDLKNNDISEVYIFEFNFKLNLFFYKINNLFKYKPLIMAFLVLKFFFGKLHGTFNLFFYQKTDFVFLS